MTFKHNYNTEDKPKLNWRTIHEEFYSDATGKPVAVKLTNAVSDGFTKHGVSITYSDRFLGLNLADLPKLIESLQKLKEFAEQTRLL